MMPICIIAQNVTIKGNVKDATGEPIIGANVKVVGNNKVGTVTDMEGNFSMSAPQTAKQLEVSFIGMKSEVVNITASRNVNVTLKDDAEQLDEVVVIGYQTIKRRDLTGSVASVTGKSLTSAPVANVAQAMQGKLPGVNIVSQDGRPDATISIRVRGGGSISQSNDPLILIDGVSGTLSDIPSDQVESIDVLKDASSTAIYGARGANGVILVTTKAAKEGKVSVNYNGYVKWNTPTKYLDALDPYDYLKYTWANAAANGSAYLDSFEKLYGLGSYATSTSGIEAYRNVPEYDVQKDVYNSSFSQSHDLSISGGNNSTKVLFDVNYMDEQGMKVNSYSKRANVSLKINQKIRDNFNIALDARYTDVSNMSNEGTTSGQGSILSYAYRFRPIATDNILGDLGALYEGNIDMYGKYSQWDMYDPAKRIADYEPLANRQHLRATLSADWGIIKGLTYHTDLSLARTWNQNKTWSGAIYNQYLDESGEVLYAGNASLSKSDSWSLRWSNTLAYDFTLNKIHHINFMAGQEVTNSAGNSMSINANHFPSNFTKQNAFAMINQYDQTAGSTTSFSSSESTPGRILSFFGRANYTLMDRYLFTATFRADGSSKFSPKHRWGYFPAAAIAWRITEEPFMKSVKWLNNLKLRLSYGEVGNDGINADLWSQTWASETDNRWKYSMNEVLQSSYDLSSTTMANEDLKWETTITRNIGLDFTLFNNRMWGTVDLYWNTTKDLLMLTTLPGITGFTSTYDNIGQTSNRGAEFSLSGVLYQNKDWSITASMNINFNKNKIDDLADGITGEYGTQWIMMNNPSNDYILEEGQAVGRVVGLVYDGFYKTSDFDYSNGMYTLKSGIADVSNAIIPTFHGIGSSERPSGQIAYPGVAKFKDLNGDGIINTEDYTVIGNMNAKHTGGFNVTAQYKNFDLGLYFNWSYGNDIYNVNKLANMYGYKETGVYENKLSFMKDAYKIYDVVDGKLIRYYSPSELEAINTNAKYPLCYNEAGLVSSFGIEDGSYLRLNTLTIGYTMPKTLLHKIGINNMRIYGTIYNLMTITGYDGLDPEVNVNTSQGNAVYPTTGLDWGSYPRARSFVLGVNINF